MGVNDWENTRNSVGAEALKNTGNMAGLMKQVQCRCGGKEDRRNTRTLEGRDTTQTQKNT